MCLDPEVEMGEIRFVEYDRMSGELIVNLPPGSQELRQTIMQRIHRFLHSDHVNKETLDHIEFLVTQVLLENSIKAD
jgi:hypothetical protein